MSEASSHAAAADTRLETALAALDDAIAAFETPQAVALSCLGKHPAQIQRMLLDCADVVAVKRGFEKGSSMADQLALRYACEAIEWLWKQTDVAEIR